MEDGIFPSIRSIGSEEDIEEERRLAYVAITRAKKDLYLTHCTERMLFGQTNRNMISRFLKEIPPSLAENIDKVAKVVYSAANKNPVGFGTKSVSLQSQIAANSAKKPEAKCTIDFAVGDRVSHNVFGEGTIVSVKKMSNDSMLEVAFDNVGSKKLMANFAKIKKI